MSLKLFFFEPLPCQEPWNCEIGTGLAQQRPAKVHSVLMPLVFFYGLLLLLRKFAKNCKASLANLARIAVWKRTWSKEKQQFCCQRYGRACEEEGLESSEGSERRLVEERAPDKTLPGLPVFDKIYDCRVGLSEWANVWSDTKKEWCCKHEHLGCAPYLCVGDAAWQQSFPVHTRNRSRHCCSITS